MITSDYNDYDYLDLLGSLRESDIKEVIQLYGEDADAYTLLHYSIKVSDELFTFRLTENSQCLGIGGVYNHPELRGHMIWFVGHKDIDNIDTKKLLWGDAKAYMTKLRSKYYRLCNYCSADDGLIRMLSKLGFEVYELSDSTVRFFECVS
jgi:hypothetical protein